jgi:S-adenosylmethionine hydrolase
MHNLLTLTTDFGLQDYYVSAMKGVILQNAPNARLVDISHQIPAQDIMAGSWVVKNSAMLFPTGTVHLVVVDPGVGTSRKPVALQVDDQLFVGPDNGIFSLLTEQYDFEAVELTNKKYWRADVSNTFHGRDVFAPVAAHLLNGAELTDLGPSLDDLETYRWAVPIADDDGIEGWVIHIDAFGNLITNISESLIDDMIANNSIKLYVGNTILDNITDTFGSVSDGEPVAYIGSAGMLEIAVNKGDAQKMLGIKKGAQISLVLQKED